MRRLLAALACDTRLQYRNGFYAAAAFVAGVLVLLLRWLPVGYRGWLLPPLVLTNMQINTFYFIGGLVLLEKAEGSLEAVVVTPLRPREYLASKVLSLAGLSLAEALAIVLASYGTGFDPWPLAVGVVLVAALYCLYGFLVVVRYDSINEYLFPSMVYTSVLSLPLLDYLGIWESRLFYLHPVQAPLVLLRAAFHPVATWQMAYGVLYGGLWVVPLAMLGGRAFRRFVVAKEGVR
jgi:fluoroquinolone transport system permease protein